MFGSGLREKFPEPEGYLLIHPSNTECLTQPGTELGGRHGAGARVGGMEGWKQTCFHRMVRNGWVGRRGNGLPGQDLAKDVATSLRAGLCRAPWPAAKFL